MPDLEGFFLANGFSGHGFQHAPGVGQLMAEEILDDRARSMDISAFSIRRFEGGDVPAPEFWGGYRLTPERIEFWQGRSDRLHDRLRYERDGDGWRVARLYP